MKKLCLVSCVLALALVAARPAAPQSCTVSPSQTPYPMFHDFWFPGGDNRAKECSSRIFQLQMATFGGKSQMWAVVGCQVSVYDVSGSAPAKTATLGLWNAGTVYAHNEYKLHQVALLDEFPYGLAAYSSEGWSLFKINYSTGGVTSATILDYLKFDRSPDVSEWVYGFRMWRGLDNHVYAIGKYLDKSSNKFKIVDLGTGASAPTLPLTVVSSPVMKGGYSLMYTTQVAGKIYLYQWAPGGVHVYDVSNPTNVIYVGKEIDPGLADIGLTSDYGPGFSAGPIIVKRGTVYRAYTRIANDKKVHIYDLSSNAPHFTHLDETSGVDPVSGAYGKVVGSDGKLLALQQPVANALDGTPLPGKMLRLFAVEDDTFTEIPSNIVWYDDEKAYTYESPYSAVVYPSGGKYMVCHSEMMRGYYATVSTACLSTTPTANLSITRSSSEAGAASCSGGHSGAAYGFPGDTFVVSNDTSGQYTFDSLVITGPDNFTQHLAVTTGSINWQAPTGSPAVLGEYTATLIVRDSTGALCNTCSDTAYIYLCDNPSASIALTHVKPAGGSWQACTTSCAYVQGFSLRYSAAGSAGHPSLSADNPTWTASFKPSGGAEWAAVTPTVNTDGTAEIVLENPGDYQIAASVAYPYRTAPVATSPLYAHSAAVTAAMQVTQGGVTIASGGSLQQTGTVTLTFTGQVAPPNTATCDWKLDGVSLETPAPSCSTAVAFDPGPSGKNLALDVQHTIALTATSTPAADSSTASFPFTVPSLTGDFSWNPTQPTIGQQVIFTASYATRPPAVRWTFDQAGCSEPTVVDVSCAVMSTCPATFHFASGGAHTVSLSFNTSSTPTVFTKVKEYTVNVTATGSCAPVCTVPSKPSALAPAASAVVPVGNVSFSWTAASGTAPISYTVMAGPVSVCTTTSTSCTKAFASAGTYSWTVTASNSCGSATSTSRSFTISGGGSTAPSAPTLRTPTNSQTVTPGAITFSWYASTGTAPITYTVMAGPITLCSTTATSCTYTLNTPSTYSWRVIASNGAGSATSATWSFTVKNPCTVPGAATGPVPANNATVQGGAVTLSWSAPTAGTTPFTYDVYFGSGATAKVCSDVSTTQCQVTNVSATPPTEYTWWVVVKGCGGQTATPAQWKFKTCMATQLPTADFTWAPGEPVSIGGVTQEQPYEGQTVSFTDTSSDFPSAWDWTDFNTPTPWVHYTEQNPTHIWTTSGNKTVRLTVTNCIGRSQQTTKTVRVWPDVRPVVASFSTSPTNPVANQPLTFTADTSDTSGNPTRFQWDFGDGSTPVETTTPSVTHSYECGRTYVVKLVSTRVKSNQVSSSLKEQSVTVGGLQCSPDGLLVADVARNVPGVNNSMWITDVDLYNPTSEDLKLKIAIKCTKPPSGMTCDQIPRMSPSFLLRAGESTDLDQLLTILQPWPGYQEWAKGELWVFRAEDKERGLPLPVVSARTHTGATAPYDDFGQFEGVYSIYMTGQQRKTLYITGAQHNGKAAQQQLRGFRTNLTFAEPGGASIAAGKVKLTLMKADDPQYVVEQTLSGMAPWTYIQYPVWRYFDGVSEDEDLGRIIIKIEMAPETSLAIGCSLVNNATNAPIFIPTQLAP